ncbi:hypothetical protein [Paramagnetospirillum magneticum]|uniref:hypothetical protein n=1 Tax=Paramagnetospirillum magneticum TaxID=84159 RepID=UPI0011D0941D|nr:hypothetical protein [Paramagnetospirillum magneticum]
MAQEQQIKQFLELCVACTATPVDQIVSHRDWGKINFEAGRGDLERMQSILNHFKVLPLEPLPDSVLVDLIQVTTPIKAALDQFSAFTIEQQDPSQVRLNILQNTKGVVDQLYLKAHLWIPFLAYQKGDVQRNIDQLSRSVVEANGIVSSAKGDIEGKYEEIRTIIAAAREASASVGVAHFTGDFSDEANSLASSAKNWLIATGLCAVITLVTAFYMMSNGLPSDAKAAQIIQHATSKVVILGLLFAATIWLGRIYKSPSVKFPMISGVLLSFAA